MDSVETEIQTCYESHQEKLHCNLSKPKNWETLHIEVDMAAKKSCRCFLTPSHISARVVTLITASISTQSPCNGENFNNCILWNFFKASFYSNNEQKEKPKPQMHLWIVMLWNRSSCNNHCKKASIFTDLFLVKLKPVTPGSNLWMTTTLAYFSDKKCHHSLQTTGKIETGKVKLLRNFKVQ